MVKCMNVNRKKKMVKVTVYVPLEVKNHLKSRRISMSRWIRSAIKTKRDNQKTAHDYEISKIVDKVKSGVPLAKAQRIVRDELYNRSTDK